MAPDFSVARVASAETTRHSAQNDEEHTTSVMPLVNIESSDLAHAPQSTGLHRRSSIEAVDQSSFRRKLPEYLRLHLSLRENQHQIDTHRNSVDSYGDQDKPIETYERNKVALRTLKSNINDNKMVCSGQNTRRYTQLQADFDKQHQQLYFLLSDNLNCAVQTFSSIGSLLNFIDSELLEFITLPGTIYPLQISMRMLFDKDQAQYPHSGNAETLQLLCRISCSVNQKLGREPEVSDVKNSLLSMLNYMVAKYMCCRLDSLNTFESIMQFIEDHGSIIKTLFSSNHSFLNEHIIKTIERLPEEICAESLFLLNTKSEDIRKDNEKIILKKAFSVLTGEVRSLTDGVIAFNRVNCSGLGKGHVAKQLFNKMCEFIKDFDDALDTFDKVTNFKPNIDGKFFDTLYKEVLTRAVSADHYYQLVKNRSFHKDMSKLFLKGLEKNPAHIELKHLHKQHIEDKIYQQFNESVGRSREALIKECQSQIDRIVGPYEREYQDKICHRINELSESFQQDIHQASFEFTEVDGCFEDISYCEETGRSYDTVINNFKDYLKTAVQLTIDTMIAAPTERMRKLGEAVINSYFERPHRLFQTEYRNIPKPAKIDEIINKIKASQTTESRFNKIKETALKNLRHKFDVHISNITGQFEKNVLQKKKELSSSLQLHHQKLDSYYANLTHMKPTDRYFTIDGFCMPYLYSALFLAPECPVNRKCTDAFDPGDEVASGDDITADLSFDTTGSTSGFDISMSEFGGSFDVDGLDLDGLDIDSLDVSDFDECFSEVDTCITTRPPARCQTSKTIVYERVQETYR